MYWNDIDTGKYSGMIAETIAIKGDQGDYINAYYSRPLNAENVPSIVLIPHMPGWDEWCRETSRRFTEHGYAVVCPDIYARVATGRPEEVSAKSREDGGRADSQVMGDVKGALDFLKLQPNTNGKVGVIGMCSGGRHAYLAACTVPGFDAAVDCWGSAVVNDPSRLTEKTPVAPIDYTEQLNIPLLGIFGNDDFSPTVPDVDAMEAKLKELGKDYEFHRYEGAGHGIWYYDKPMYRQQQAMDSFEKVMEFFEKHLR